MWRLTGMYNNGTGNDGTYNLGVNNTGNFNRGISNDGDANQGELVHILCDGCIHVPTHPVYVQQLRSRCPSAGTYNAGQVNSGNHNNGIGNLGDGNNGEFAKLVLAYVDKAT